MFKGTPAPDPGWIPFLKLMFGFGLLLVLAILSGIIAVKTVRADSSYGLEIILGGLLTLSGGFSQWCFGEITKTPKTPGETSSTPPANPLANP